MCLHGQALYLLFLQFNISVYTLSTKLLLSRCFPRDIVLAFDVALLYNLYKIQIQIAFLYEHFKNNCIKAQMAQSCI